jgi:hypothetical protein
MPIFDGQTNNNKNYQVMSKMNTIPTDITRLPVVEQTIRIIRVMWDVRIEKPFGNHWLNGMDETAEKALSMLFAQYAEGYETTGTFARRLARV